MKNKAIVLLSGGVDSLVTTALALKEYNVSALHVCYHQRTETREKKAFNDICKYYGILDKFIVETDHLRKIGGSSLTDKNIKPNKGSKIPISYVPFRNSYILSIAVSWSEVIGAKKIFIGANAQDFSGYPDCRPEFYDAFNKVIDIGTKPETKIEISTPIINMSKKQIVETGKKFDVPFHLSWSCYKNEKKACGKCDSCKFRKKGFKEAGLDDPIDYE